MGPSTDPEQPRRGFPHAAATASLAMPLIALMLRPAWEANERAFGFSASSAFVGKVLVGWLILLCIGIGVGFAIVALCNVGRYESRGLLRRGIIGLIVNGLFVALFGLAFLTGYAQRVKARQTERDLLRATHELRDSTRNSFDTERGLTNVNTEQLERFREQLETAAPHLEGDQALVVKVWSVYLAKVQAASAHWQQMYNEVGAAKVLDFSEVTSKEQLRQRQELVQRYQASSDAMRELVVNASQLHRDELRKLKTPADQTDKIVGVLEAQHVKQRFLLLEIRDA